MEVVVDPDLCEGNAICSALAPSVFVMNDEYLAEVVPGAGAEELGEIQKAVDACPRSAIRFER